MIFDDIVEAVISDDDHPVNIALRDNDVYDWTPKSETRLLYCQADDQVAFENSIIARDKMVENGAEQVVAIDMNPNFNHTECVTPAATTFVLYLILFADLTSTDELAETAFNIYPNPSTGSFQIDSDITPSDFTVDIYSMSGELLERISNTRSGNVIHSNLKSGIYILSVSDKNGNNLAHQKIVIHSAF